MNESFEWFVGIDWATDAHQVCVCDRSGQIVLEREVRHDARDVQAWIEWLRDMTGGALDRVAVAIETPRGALVDTLIERGCAVFALNPKQLDRFRDRFTAAGAKDDRRDGRVLSQSLRTDPAAFRPVRVDDPLIIQLRELRRMEEDLQVDLGRLTSRLREQIFRVHPPVLELCPAADEPWFWTLVELVLPSLAGRRLTATDVRTILRTHRIRRVTAEQVLDRSRAPRLYTAPGVLEATRRHVASLVERLRITHAQWRRGLQQSEELLESLRQPAEGAEDQPAEHRDIAILESLPGIGRQITATMLTEAGRPLADRDYATLRACVGTAPVTKRSGKRQRPFVQMRRACSQRLRYAAYHWGRVSIQHDPRAREYYDGLRARGHSHARALRAVVDRWLRILVAMLRTRTLYDATRHLAAPVTAPA